MSDLSFHLLHTWRSIFFLAPLITWYLWMAARLPIESRWNHHYHFPKESIQRRSGWASTAGIALLLLLTGSLALATFPTGFPLLRAHVLQEIAARGLLRFLASPSFLMAFTGLLAEFYLSILLLGGILAQAAPPDFPDWIKRWFDLILLIGLTFANFAWELAGLPAGPIGIALTLLASAILVLLGMWAYWVSMPNTPLRAWFCANIADNHFAPYPFLWSTVVRCAKWGWIGFWQKEVAIFEFFWEVEVAIWDFFTMIVREVVQFVRTVVKWVETTIDNSTWVPNWLKKTADWVIDKVLVAVDVIEVISQVVIHIVIIHVLLFIVFVWWVVTFVVFFVFVILKWFCLAWFGLVISLFFWLIFLWLIPVFWMRLLFLN